MSRAGVDVGLCHLLNLIGCCCRAGLPFIVEAAVRSINRGSNPGALGSYDFCKPRMQSKHSAAWFQAH